MMCGILFRQMEVSGRITPPYNLQLFCCSMFCCGFMVTGFVMMTGFTCQMAVISSKRGTLSPPAFKSGFFRFYVPLRGLT